MLASFWRDREMVADIVLARAMEIVWSPARASRSTRELDDRVCDAVWVVSDVEMTSKTLDRRSVERACSFGVGGDTAR